MAAPMKECPPAEHEDNEWNSEEDEEDEELWEECADHETEDDRVPIKVKCLFCNELCISAEEVFTHCRQNHSFDILNFQKKHDLDSIAYIKLINYTRTVNPSPDELAAIPAGPSLIWNDDLFMKPVLEDDNLLLFDIESVSSDLPPKDSSLDKDASLPELFQKMQYLEKRALNAEQALELTVKRAREFAQNVVLSDESHHESEAVTQAAAATVEEDSAYFESYAHYSIHQEMLKDTARTESYRNFIYQNPAVFKDKVVLDLGCGTGILSMFAAKAGARHVIGIDQSDIIYQTMDIVRENGLEKVITLVKGRVEDVELPYEEVDVIISEWMGYFLLFEAMLDSVLYARDRWLAPEGTVYPDQCRIYLQAVDDQDSYSSKISFWEDVYGFKMNCMKSCVLDEATVEIISLDKIISDSCLVKCIDVCNDTLSDLDFSAEFSFKINRDGHCTALIGYFDVLFEKRCNSQVTLSTGPESIPTHWKQTVFNLGKPISVQKGQTLKGKIFCKKNRKELRSLIVHITLEGSTRKYFIQ